MTPEAKLRILEANALTRLSRPIDALATGLDRPSGVVLIWRYPAFEPYQSWCLIRVGLVRDAKWLVRRTSWARSVDHERAANPLKQASLMIDPDPIPTIEVSDARMDGDHAREFLGRLGRISLPPLLTSEGIGIDGVLNGLETNGGRVHLEWWCDGPPEWRELTEAVERLRLELETVLT